MIGDPFEMAKPTKAAAGDPFDFFVDLDIGRTIGLGRSWWKTRNGDEWFNREHLSLNKKPAYAGESAAPKIRPHSRGIQIIG